MTTLEILIGAKALLNKTPHSWIKMKAWDDKGGYCALGACYRAVSNSDSYTLAATPAIECLNKAAREVAEELGRPLREDVRGDRYDRVDAAYFNNTAKDLDEVNKMFCRAIEKEAEAEGTNNG